MGTIKTFYNLLFPSSLWKHLDYGILPVFFFSFQGVLKLGELHVLNSRSVSKQQGKISFCLPPRNLPFLSFRICILHYFFCVMGHALRPKRDEKPIWPSKTRNLFVFIPQTGKGRSGLHELPFKSNSNFNGKGEINL